LVIFVQLSCGYRIAGLDDFSIKEKFYIAAVHNNTTESEFSTILTSEVNDFFSKYNLLTKKKETASNIFVSLTKIDYKSKILQSYSRAISSDLSIDVEIVVKREGMVIYKKSFSDANSYTISTNITETLNNRKNAFIKSLNSILMDFLHDYKEKNTDNR